METVTSAFDAAYWRGRYAAGRDGWDARAATPPLRAYFDQLDVARQPRILIPGAGRAYEAEYLHQVGFRQVFVADLAPEALQALAARVPAFPAEHLLLADFFALPHAAPYDLIVEQTFFCALSPALRPAYARHCCGRPAHSWACCSTRISGRCRSHRLGAPKKNTGSTSRRILSLGTSQRPRTR